MLIPAGADGIPVHYRAEGNWDLGAQWGVTLLNEGRELVINDNDTQSSGVSSDE